MLQFYRNFRAALIPFKLTHTDIIRTLLMGTVVWLAFSDDASNIHIVKVVLGFFFSMIVITHYARRLMLPYIDLGAYAKKALTENSVSSAIVFASIMYFLATLFSVGSSFFK